MQCTKRGLYRADKENRDSNNTLTMRTGIGLKQGTVNEISESNVSVKIRAKSKKLHFFLNLAEYYLDLDICGSFSAIFSK
jgi:hypothetical protein